MKKIGPEIINGIYIFLLVGIFFMSMEALGLSDNMYLRLLNILFVFVFVNRTVKQKVNSGEISFLSNFGSAILTGFVGVFLSIIGLTVYIFFIKGIDYITQLAPSIITSGAEVSLTQYCFALFAEGLSSSMIVAFMIMQYWKNSKVPNGESMA